ncbi:MAG TPA: hypothetical protein VKI65_00530 [Gemmataceae bacterium]|nr:hypothetical protein [Gemmataceae bacterium]
MELREGSHRLRFTAVDKNPKASACWMGIDCVKLISTDTSRGQPLGSTDSAKHR